MRGSFEGMCLLTRHYCISLLIHGLIKVTDALRKENVLTTYLLMIKVVCIFCFLFLEVFVVWNEYTHT